MSYSTPAHFAACPSLKRRSKQISSNVVVCSLRQQDLKPAAVPAKLSSRQSLRLGVPSKGRMAEDTMQLLKDCQLGLVKPNPRQYIATIAQMPQLEVWFQRATDVVRKLMYGDIDIGIVGYDMFQEICGGDPDLIVLHESLNFGHCHLGLGVPMTGRFADINTLDDLKAMPEWTETNPLRVVTGYHQLARRFFAKHGFQHVVLLTADGALEAAPLMGSADIILDLISTGITLRENNLKQLEGAEVLRSQGVLVASRRALLERPGMMEVVHELLERLEAHLKADDYYSVVANMRGSSAEEVASLIMSRGHLGGLQGPTISPVYTHGPSENGASGVVAQHGFYAVTICVPKKLLYQSVKELRQVGGSGVLVQPMTYIFDEEPLRWRRLLDTLEAAPQ
ncbi:hypothetical protein WJX84_003004 [Apatococcus fuscideae]|uniref:ATP phosphoribosyltransferase n=1 Tax=Apatococcus fuscideae TaxID=2026836 RepID=A0AAW1SV84_9CHLO